MIIQKIIKKWTMLLLKKITINMRLDQIKY